MALLKLMIDRSYWPSSSKAIPWFKSASESVSFISSVVAHPAKIESIRNKLCYGKRQEEVILEKLVENFNSLKQIFVEVTKYEL